MQTATNYRECLARIADAACRGTRQARPADAGRAYGKSGALCGQKTALAKQFPLLMTRLWTGADKLSKDDTIESVINQGTLGIGFIGLAECLVALTGKHHGESDEAQQLGLRIV